MLVARRCGVITAPPLWIFMQVHWGMGLSVVLEKTHASHWFLRETLNIAFLSLCTRAIWPFNFISVLRVWTESYPHSSSRTVWNPTPGNPKTPPPPPHPPVVESILIQFYVKDDFPLELNKLYGVVLLRRIAELCDKLWVNTRFWLAVRAFYNLRYLRLTIRLTLVCIQEISDKLRLRHWLQHHQPLAVGCTGITCWDPLLFWPVNPVACPCQPISDVYVGWTH